ncbi:hypothetical protein DACRYDRAFT_114517 [Dacryopinax primogenitus]|uniref:GRF-type domain-containing protein n=1 Tax=Dacryopinax primogenitus (strain DJM 731) TaxID=1858805 RepID=M5G5V9_DACPD|nr:uncharacterized protein DACRYDRAFT_114517 [Dacryopinax primogenitus]EJU04109.1 hypothetical protein DACRYDRAFT_114517 [Dacryopinax primogenitus]
MTTRVQSGLQDNGTVKCFHGDIAIRLQAKTDANKGRWFYSESSSILVQQSFAYQYHKECNNQEAPCKFFKWEDQLMAGSSPQSSQSTAAGTSYTPKTTTRFASDSGRRLGSPPSQSSPTKRPADETIESDDGMEELLSGSPSKKLKFTPQHKTQESPSRSTWQSIQDDPNNPFHVTASNVRGIPDTPSATSTAPASTFNTPSHLSSSHEVRIADLRAASMILNGLPDRIERLERKLLAAERSNAHKTRRMGELEEENKELKNELLEKMRKAEVLETTIDALRASR